MFNKNFKKQIIYFGGAFLITWIMIILYGVYELIRYQTALIDTIENLWYLTVLITTLLVAYELMLWVLTRKHRKRHSVDDFNHRVADVVHKTLGYEKEDFKNLRENLKFQKALSDIYTIVTEGETSALNYDGIRERFKADDPTVKVIEIIIQEGQSIHADKTQ